MRFVSYLRVSTTAQGGSGLGVEAQRAAVASYVNGTGELIGEHVEIETGTRDDRPELAAALADCRKAKATLVIARLDRLGRRAVTLLALRDAGVPIVVCDMPHADKLYFGMRAVFAEEERDLISKRTRAALQAAKACGKVLGSPNPQKGAAIGRASRTAAADRFAANVLPVIREVQAAGCTTLKAIAAALTARGIAAPRGGAWGASQVRRVLARERRRRPP